MKPGNDGLIKPLTGTEREETSTGDAVMSGKWLKICLIEGSHLAEGG